MKLTVLASAETVPWYANGLRFSCTQCGNCCTGGPGYVWISVPEIQRLAEFLNLTAEQTIERYCRKIDGRFSLSESRGAGGSWDCIFLKTEPAARGGDGLAHTRRVCSIYPVRPQQCRAWPFWDSNLRSRQDWDRAAFDIEQDSDRDTGPLLPFPLTDRI